MSFAPARSENVICIGDRATSLRESSEGESKRARGCRSGRETPAAVKNANSISAR